MPIKMVNWIRIKDKIPEEGKRLLYFFEGTGVWLGFYYGRDESFPFEDNHVFGSEFGFLTGDVTHWSYIPTYPKDSEWRTEADKEFFKENKKEMLEVQKEWNDKINEMQGE